MTGGHSRLGANDLGSFSRGVTQDYDTGRSTCAAGQCARAAYKILSEISKYIDRNFRSTVTVAYIIIYTTYRENVALKSQVWGSLTLAQLQLTIILPYHLRCEVGVYRQQYLMGKLAV